MRNNNKRTQKPKFNNVVIEVPVKFGDRISDTAVNELIELLSSDFMDRITMNVFAFRSVINNDSTAKGKVVVGNVVKYDTEKEVLIVEIFENFVDIIQSIQNRIAFVSTSFNREKPVLKVNRIIIEEEKHI